MVPSKVAKSPYGHNHKCVLWRITNFMGSKVSHPYFRNYDGANGFHGYHLL